MTLTQLFKDLKCANSRKDEIKKIKKQLKSLALRLDKLESIDKVCNRVKYIYKDIPLDVYPLKPHLSNVRQSFTIKGIADIGNDRIAEVYPNANNNTTWGVNVNEYFVSGTDHRWYGGLYLGSSFTKEEAIKLAQDWVAFNTLPTKFERSGLNYMLSKLNKSGVIFKD